MVETILFEDREGFAASSRFLSGHFPGNPVVPGAVILAYLARCLADHALAMTHVQRVKFLRPVLPDTPLETTIRRRRDGARFEIRDEAGVLVSGRCTLGPIQ